MVITFLFSLLKQIYFLNSVKKGGRNHHCAIHKGSSLPSFPNRGALLLIWYKHTCRYPKILGVGGGDSYDILKGCPGVPWASVVFKCALWCSKGWFGINTLQYTQGTPGTPGFTSHPTLGYPYLRALSTEIPFAIFTRACSSRGIMFYHIPRFSESEHKKSIIVQ
jgi:hypothetical protein